MNKTPTPSNKKSDTTINTQHVSSHNQHEKKREEPKTELEADVSLKEMFGEIDQDKSGSISFDEFRKFMNDSGVEEAMSDKEIQDMIGHVDKNKDKKISYNEFVKIMTSMK